MEKLDLIAGAHALGAEDAPIHIQGEEGVALIQRVGRLHPQEAALLRHHIGGHLLQFAPLVGRAGEAITVAVGHEEFHQGAAHPIDEGRGGPHHHPFSRLSGAGRRETSPPLYLHDAEATAAIRLQVIIGAEGRDIDTSALRRLEQRHPLLRLYRPPVYL